MNKISYLKFLLSALSLLPFSLLAQELETPLTSSPSEMVMEAKVGSITVEQLSESIITQSENSTLLLTEVTKEQLVTLPDFENIFGQSLLNRVGPALTEKSSAELLWVRPLAKNLLKEDSSSYQKIDELFAIAERAELLAGAEDVKGLGSFYQEQSEKVGMAIVGSRLMKLVVQFANANLNSGNPAEALHSLSYLNENENEDDGQVELLNKAVDSLVGMIDSNPGFLSETWPFEAEQIHKVINKAQSKSPQLKEKIIKLYAWRAVERTTAGDASSAKRAFGFVIKNRLDPSSDNDQLRLQIAFEAKTPETQQFADELISNLKDEERISVIDNLRISITRMGVNSIIEILIYVIAGLLALFTFIFAKSFFSAGSFKTKLKETFSKNEPGYRKTDLLPDQYSILVSFIGLSDTATEEEIKGRYRELVKVWHPDQAVQSGISEERATERFRQLQENYKKIMEIRKAWFGN